jgi:hypothetical protein
MIPTSPLRKLELSTKSQLQVESLSTAFPTPLTLASFLAKAKRTFINFPTAHHNLGNYRAMPSHLGGFISKSNKCHKDCFTKLKCSNTHTEDSLNPNLDFSQITQTSQRGVGESSQRLRNECVLWLASAPSKEGRGKTFVPVPQKLEIENYPVKN